jgi:hypothetical protein
MVNVYVTASQQHDNNAVPSNTETSAMPGVEQRSNRGIVDTVRLSVWKRSIFYYTKFKFRDLNRKECHSVVPGVYR